MHCIWTSLVLTCKLYRLRSRTNAQRGRWRYANFLCLPKDPDWDNFINGQQQWTGRVGGVEYELSNTHNNVFDESNTGGITRESKPAPCAVCYVNRHSIIMVPAKTQCPDGWNKEYGGYLASEASSIRKRSNYMCWDRSPEISAGDTAQNQAAIYPVEVVCGSLPCSTYITGKELTCVVCSKWHITDEMYSNFSCQSCMVIRFRYLIRLYDITYVKTVTDCC